MHSIFKTHKLTKEKCLQLVSATILQSCHERKHIPKHHISCMYLVLCASEGCNSSRHIINLLPFVLSQYYIPISLSLSVIYHKESAKLS